MQLTRKINQLENKLNQFKEITRYRNGMNTLNLRKARTRTLIQLGGLIEKAGLLPFLNLDLGDDLQKDEDCFEGTSILLGALIDIQKNLDEDNAQKLLWRERGKKALANI